jgi:hypothetical protein
MKIPTKTLTAVNAAAVALNQSIIAQKVYESEIDAQELYGELEVNLG